MTAGHNAVRGSGPDQKLAFDDAVALVGRPDRQIDRLCIATFYIDRDNTVSIDREPLSAEHYSGSCKPLKIQNYFNFDGF